MARYRSGRSTGYGRARTLWPLGARIRYGTTRALTLTRLEVGRRRYVWRVTLDGQEYGVTAPKGVRLTPGQRVHAELVFHLSKGFFAVYATKPQGLNDGQYLGRATLIQDAA